MQDYPVKVNNYILDLFFKNPEISPSTYNFSEIGSDALLVLEELQRREGVVFIISANDSTNNPLWVVGNKAQTMILASKTEGRLPEDGSFAASAPTFSMAICLAALKSLNVKV